MKELEAFLPVVNEDLEDINDSCQKLMEWAKTKNVPIMSSREKEYEVIKKLIKDNKFDELRKQPVIRKVIATSAKVLGLGTSETEIILTEVIWDAQRRGRLDFTKAKSLGSLTKYLLKTAMYETKKKKLEERIGLEGSELRDYREAERIRTELRQELGREPCEDEFKERLLKEKKRKSEYFNYIQDLQKKAKKKLSYREEKEDDGL